MGMSKKSGSTPHTRQKPTTGVKRVKRVRPKEKPRHPNHGGARPGGGKPKGSGTIVPLDVKSAFGAKCREYSDEALEFLVGIMRAKDTKEHKFSKVREDWRLRADQAQLLIAYGLGRPAQSHEVHGTMQGMIGVQINWEKFENLPPAQMKMVEQIFEIITDTGPAGDQKLLPSPDASDSKS